MSTSYPLPGWVLRATLLLAPAGAALAQVPVITSVIPMANARAAARNSPVTINFNQPLTAASAGALKVFSSQRGGLRTRGTTPAVVSGSALSFAPTAYDFRPGETVQYTVTTAAASSGGALAAARVGQFRAAVGGTGVGNFQPIADPTVGSYPISLAVGDIDGDGDLDLLTANYTSPGTTVSVRLNNGSGTFTGSQEVGVGNSPSSLVLGDVDGDGDLDLLTTNEASNTVSVRLNDGSGTFSGTQNIPVGTATSVSPVSIALGDVDGDGDLDVLAANALPLSRGTVSVRLNNGNGVFSGSQEVSAGSGTRGVAVGDVDGDGDLDLLMANSASQSNSVSIRVNDGNGTFTGTQEVSVGSIPRQVVVEDVDGDGDLDLLTANYGSASTPGTTVSVRVNSGNGLFSGSQNVPTNSYPANLVLGDVDSDGDLDLFVAATQGSTGVVSVRMNDGSGVFSGSQGVAVGVNPQGIVVGDIDRDGDLDLLTTTAAGAPGTVSIRLNGGTGPLTATAGRPTAAFTLFPNPAHGAATLTGTTPNAPLAVLDALGRVLLTATADATGTARLLLPEGLPAGVYLVRSGEVVRRLVVE